MTEYKVIRIYTREGARCEGKLLSHAVLSAVHDLGTAARCGVFRGIEGLYENGERVSASLVEGSADLPLLIDILVPEAEAAPLLERLEAMVTEGFVALSPALVSSFRPPSSPLPPRLLVRDLMTRRPVAAHLDFSLRSAVELLLDRGLKSLPVVDAEGIPRGMLTQGDLAARAALPLRLGLLETLRPELREAWLRSLEELRLDSVMSPDPKTVREDQRAAVAVHLMAKERLKRLPVVDGKGRLVGMLSRIDVLRALRLQGASAAGPRPFSAAPGSDTSPAAAGEPGPRVGQLAELTELSLAADSPLEAALELLRGRGSERAAVLDGGGRLVGVVTDRSLIEALDRRASPLAGLLALFSPRGRRGSVAELMLRSPLALGVDQSLDEALRLMTEECLKLVPLVDGEGRFRGFLRRDSLLLALAGGGEGPSFD